MGSNPILSASTDGGFDKFDHRFFLLPDRNIP